MMLHQNFARYVGRPIDTTLQQIEDEFFGRVVVYAPAQVPDETITPARLKVFVDDLGIITQIVNG